MNVVLTFATLFFVGSVGGWVFEVLFRKFLSDSNPDHRWINPGFLVGPYLPIYGFGLAGMYLLCRIPLDFVTSVPLQILLRLVVITLVMTLIEYLAGLIFIKGMRIKLWDYTERWGNIQGIICPLFTLIWGVGGAAYYFLVHPRVLSGLDWLSRNLAYSFFVGFFFGVLIIDFGYSMHIVVKIRKFAADNQIVVRFEEFKANIKKNRELAKEKARFIFAFRTERPLGEHLNKYLEFKRAQEEKLRERFKGKKK